MFPGVDIGIIEDTRKVIHNSHLVLDLMIAAFPAYFKDIDT